RIWHAGRIDRVAWAIFSCVGEVGLVQHGIRKCAEPVGVDSLDFRRTLDAVGTRAVCRNVESLIGVFGPIVAVGTENLILGVQIVIHAAKNGGIALLVDDGK